MVISLANAAFCRLPFCCDQFDMESFTTGLLAGLALMLIVGLIVHLCMKGSGACKLIHIVDGENGDFNITSSAVRSFLQRIVADYPQLDLNSIALKNTRNGLTLDLYLNVLPETDLVTCARRSGNGFTLSWKTSSASPSKSKKSILTSKALMQRPKPSPSAIAAS